MSHTANIPFITQTGLKIAPLREYLFRLRDSVVLFFSSDGQTRHLVVEQTMVFYNKGNIQYNSHNYHKNNVQYIPKMNYLRVIYISILLVLACFIELVHSDTETTTTTASDASTPEQVNATTTTTTTTTDTTTTNTPTTFTSTTSRWSIKDEICKVPTPFDPPIPPDDVTILRMITKDELAFHDGNQTSTVWLSIMSKVFDVTAGPEYYSPEGPYRVFVGRDANVPFITGVFNPEEADKPLIELENHQLFALDHWSQFYDDEARYPFVGLLIGELYDEYGNPTESMKLVQTKIGEAKILAEERKRKTAELIERRKREADAKKNKS